jgi:hypothetical protein
VWLEEQLESNGLRADPRTPRALQMPIGSFELPNGRYGHAFQGSFQGGGVSPASRSPRTTGRKLSTQADAQETALAWRWRSTCSIRSTSFTAAARRTCGSLQKSKVWGASSPVSNKTQNMYRTEEHAYTACTRDTARHSSSSHVSTQQARGQAKKAHTRAVLWLYPTVSTLITQATAVPSLQVTVASLLPPANANPLTRTMKSYTLEAYLSETTAYSVEPSSVSFTGAELQSACEPRITYPRGPVSFGGGHMSDMSLMPTRARLLSMPQKATARASMLPVQLDAMLGGKHTDGSFRDVSHLMAAGHSPSAMSQRAARLAQ